MLRIRQAHYLRNGQNLIATSCRTARSRYFATEAASPKASTRSKTEGSDPYSNSPWRHPLASAHTLSLFSQSPPALLFALEQSLQGALSAIGKTNPDKEAHVLAFAVDKTLPGDVLAETTRLLRDVPIPHVGVLSDPLPYHWLPNTGDEMDQNTDASATQLARSKFHTVSFAILPSSLVKPFHSTIAGTHEVKAGRWATGKPSFDENASRVDQLGGPVQDSSSAPSNDQSEGGWRQVWGKENFSGALPTQFADISRDSHLLTVLLASDKAPQGLLEGLDAKYGRGDVPASASSSNPLMGSFATNTFFETGGRDRCMFIRQPGQGKESQVVQSGAVGFVFALDKASAAQKEKPRLHLTTPWQNMISLGQRREVTRAKGNIVSELQGSNACQHFLRDVAQRRKAGRAEESIAEAKEAVENQASGKPMDAATQRALSESVGKEEEFWAAIWSTAKNDGSNGAPLLLSRIQSGHPGRGTVSLETDLDLLTGPGEPSAGATSSKYFLEFYQHVPDAGDSEAAIIELPGPDMGAWALPRFLFVNTPEPEHAAPTEDENKGQQAEPKKVKPQVHALPNLFVLPSSGGGLLQRQSLSDRRNDGVRPASFAHRTATWGLPGTRLLVDLRGK